MSSRPWNWHHLITLSSHSWSRSLIMATTKHMVLVSRFKRSLPPSLLIYKGRKWLSSSYKSGGNRLGKARRVLLTWWQFRAHRRTSHRGQGETTGAVSSLKSDHQLYLLWKCTIEKLIIIESLILKAPHPSPLSSYHSSLEVSRSVKSMNFRNRSNANRLARRVSGIFPYILLVWSLWYDSENG